MKEAARMRRSTALRNIAAPLAFAAIPLRARGAEMLHMRVAYAAVELSSAFYSALDEGFFQKAGLIVDAQPMPTGSGMSAAVVAGSVESGVVNVVSMAQAYDRNVPLAYIALDGLYSSSDPADAIVVTAGSPIRGGAGLNGKTVAVNVLNGIAYLGVRSWVDKNGGDSSSVRFVEMPFSTMPAALQAGRVDAILVSEPELRHAREGGGRVLGFAYDAIAPRFMVAGWVASKPWISANLETAKRFHAAMQAADVWANHNRDKTAVLVQKYTKVELSTVRTMSRATFPEHGDVRLAQPVIDAAARYGLVKSAFPAAELFSREVVG